MELYTIKTKLQVLDYDFENLSLQTLTGPMTLKTSSMMGSVRDVATKTKGWMGSAHIDTVRHFTEMQWSYGIYGSVGEIGVYYGKLASVLATFTATDYGERFFVCDIFINPKHYMKVRTAIGRKEEFEKTMKLVGFSMFTNDEPKRIRVWDDSSIYLSKLLYKTMNLPSFRMYSIDGNHFEPFVLNDLKHVSCVLREGGIIAVDDYDNAEKPGIKSALKYFMKMYGSNVIVPLVTVFPKIYLCTASWHDKYMTYIAENGIDKAMKWCKQTKVVLDIESTLFQPC